MDEEQTDGYREPCAQCSAVDWGVSDEGRFYCRTCHNVIERTREFEDTSFMAGSNRISTIAKGARRKRTEHRRQWMVCEGFQFILKNQAEALLNLGVCPQFKDDVLCQLWRMYLQKSQQAYTNNPVRTSRFKVRTQESESDSAPESVVSASETDGDGDWPSAACSVSGNSSDGWSSVCSGSLDAASYLTPRQRRGRRLMSMPKTLALCHLALLWVREAITLADLLRLVNDGHIPYLNAYESFPEEVKLYGRDSLIFSTQSIPSHRALHKEAHTLAVYLGLPPFPSITQHCLLHPALLTVRYLTEANLPEELHDWVCRVMEQAHMVDESLHTYEPMSGSVLPFYDVQAAALIIVTMKLLFKLDDHTEWDLSNDAGDKHKETPENNSFSVRKWFKVIQSALIRARQTQQQNIARKQWKSQKPLYPSKKDKSVVLKRRRVTEQVQICFEKLSGSPPGPPPSSPSSFRFCWGDSEGGDGPSLHQMKVDSVVLLKNGVLRLSNPEYWHPVLRACKSRVCRSHYEEVEATLPKSYVWLLELFSFILGVKPVYVYEEVLKVERRFLKSKSQSRPRGTPRKHLSGRANKAKPKSTF